MVLDGAPRRVDGYVIHGAIASGGMATVHYGWREGAKGFGRLVAIKALHPHLAREREVVAMLIDEARLAARLHHPNIAPVLDVVASQGELLVVIEYVAGAPLSLLLKRAAKRDLAIDPSIAVAIVGSLLRALHAAHEATGDDGQPLGIVHRDVSPQNILVGDDGVVRLVDFGIAKAAGRIQTTRDGQRKGKLAYMAPEQIEGGAIDRRCDLYAAAIVLWELLTSGPLYGAEDEHAVLVRRLEPLVAPSARRPTVPGSFDDVTLRGLEREARRRFPTARAMAEALEACTPQASPTEVTQWVRSLASDFLAEREREAAEVEATHAMEPRPASKKKRAPLWSRTRATWAFAILGVMVLAGVTCARVRETQANRAVAATATIASGGALPPVESATEEHAIVPVRAPPSAIASTMVMPTPIPSSTSSEPASNAARKSNAVPQHHVSCTPPFHVDANGVKRYKLECL